MYLTAFNNPVSLNPTPRRDLQCLNLPGCLGIEQLATDSFRRRMQQPSGVSPQFQGDTRATAAEHLAQTVNRIKNPLIARARANNMRTVLDQPDSSLTDDYRDSLKTSYEAWDKRATELEAAATAKNAEKERKKAEREKNRINKPEKASASKKRIRKDPVDDSDRPSKSRKVRQNSPHPDQAIPSIEGKSHRRSKSSKLNPPVLMIQSPTADKPMKLDDYLKKQSSFLTFDSRRRSVSVTTEASESSASEPSSRSVSPVSDSSLSPVDTPPKPSLSRSATPEVRKTRRGSIVQRILNPTPNARIEEIYRYRQIEQPNQQPVPTPFRYLFAKGTNVPVHDSFWDIELGYKYVFPSMTVDFQRPLAIVPWEFKNPNTGQAEWRPSIAVPIVDSSNNRVVYVPRHF